MRYHLVFTVFFIHLFFLMNIYIKDEISAPESYVTCDFADVSVESLKCHQQSVAQSKQFLHYVTYLEHVDGAEYKASEMVKINIRTNEFRVEGVKLSLRKQEVKAKIAQITDTTPPRIISALQRQRKYLMVKIGDFFDRYTQHHEKRKAFFASLLDD
ncbi:MAG: hypothetical protein K0U39_05525 [Alphaproteobacteria bacterium]|nr:hypothetical protein [Alphaproteobacteria bacterium]